MEFRTTRGPPWGTRRHPGLRHRPSGLYNLFGTKTKEMQTIPCGWRHNQQIHRKQYSDLSSKPIYTDSPKILGTTCRNIWKLGVAQHGVAIRPRARQMETNANDIRNANNASLVGSRICRNTKNVWRVANHNLRNDWDVLFLVSLISRNRNIILPVGSRTFRKRETIYGTCRQPRCPNRFKTTDLSPVALPERLKRSTSR